MVSAIHKMNMGVIEAGKQKFALRVEHLCLWPMPRIHFRRAANGNNTLPKDGKSFSMLSRFIDCPNFGVGYNQIG
jgi:hypothetical protein